MLGTDLYRDAYVGIRARLAELEVRLREHEEELTEAFWASLEPYVRERLGALREALALVTADSLEDLTRAEAELSAYVDELDELLDSVPALEEAWLEVPSEVADPPPLRKLWSVGHSPDGIDLVERFRTLLVEMHREVELVDDGPWSAVARFRHRDAPFGLRATAMANGNGHLGEVAMHLVTSVARATPALVVRHESLFAAVAKGMGWKHEVEVGDPSFDGLFLILGKEKDALRLLTPNVRASLMTLARYDVPTLEIDPPRRIASLTWFFEPSLNAIEAAIRTLSAIREMPGEISFRR